MSSKAHRLRVKQELTKVGMSNYGQYKMTSRYLPVLIAEDEHIKGVIYGHCARGLAMVVATDQRVIYLERHPGFTASDDISYDVVASITQNTTVLATSVTLHTRVGNYTLNFVNAKCAKIFVHYIEKRIEHNIDSIEQQSPSEIKIRHVIEMPSDAKKFLRENDTGVLSTSDRTGEVYSAVVYYLLARNNLYVLTKSETAKARNIRSRSEVALTVYDANRIKTVQIRGIAEIETNLKLRQQIFDALAKPRRYENELLMPPVTQIKAGAYIPIKITPTFARYSDFKRSDGIIPLDVNNS